MFDKSILFISQQIADPLTGLCLPVGAALSIETVRRVRLVDQFIGLIRSPIELIRCSTEADEWFCRLKVLFRKLHIAHGAG